MTLNALFVRRLAQLTGNPTRFLPMLLCVSLATALSIGSSYAADTKDDSSTRSSTDNANAHSLLEPVVIDSQPFSGGFGINEIDTSGVLKNAPAQINTDFLNSGNSFDNNMFLSGAPAFVNTLPFSLDADLDGGDVVFTVSMRDKSYVYKNSILITSNKEQVRFAEPILPEAVVHKDALGTSEVYFDKVDIRVPLIKSNAGAVLTFNYQGCDESGICYPPQSFTFVIKKEMSEDDVLLAREEATHAANESAEAKAKATAAAASSTTDTDLNVGSFMDKEAAKQAESSSASAFENAESMNGNDYSEDYPQDRIEPTVSSSSALLNTFSQHAAKSNGSATSSSASASRSTAYNYSAEELDKIGVTSVDELSRYASGNYDFEANKPKDSPDATANADAASTAASSTAEGSTTAATKSFNPPAQRRSIMDYLIQTEGQSDAISSLLTDNLLIGLLLCFALGVGLDLTPCVLPMLPIFSAMIIGPQGSRRVNPSTNPGSGNGKNVEVETISRSERLRHLAWQNFGFAMGLSLTYTVLGVAFSLLGASLHGLLQSPILTAVIAIMLLICAAACAGIFELKMPQGFTNKLQAKISVLNTSSFSGAFILGLLSALIASPCTSAPLAGALLYVMQSGNLMLGALVFFAIGLGMAAPLFIIGVFGAKFLQRSGIAGEAIKRVMAILLIVTAFVITRHMMGRAESLLAAATIFVCSAYTISTFLFIIIRKKLPVWATSISIIAAAGFTFMSLPYIQQTNDHNTYAEFYGATSEQNLNTLISNNKAYVVFTAEWCTNCKFMEKTIYSQKPFLSASSSLRRVVINITDTTDPKIKALVDKYNVVGVPYFITLDRKGNIVDSALGIATEEQVLHAIEKLNDLP